MGGSIGGLTAALVLRDLGCRVDVFERSQFRHDWIPGDPSLRLGLYGPGR
jgi:flavin-dependent dehydrogenase